MFDEQYFRSLSLELDSLKNRVRGLISHWQTDGEWKESVLRSFLRRQLTKSVEIGRGFVITDAGPTHQLDVLIYDSTKPILFQDGDLVIITPDVALGVIEVKTRVDNSQLRKALGKLCVDMERIQRRSPGRRAYGLFSFEDDTTDAETTLQMIKNASEGDGSRIVPCVCLGDSKFVRYWALDPTEGKNKINKWHAYTLNGTAQGYFIHNIIEIICPQSIAENEHLWYPKEGKESYKSAEIGFFED